MGSPLTPHTNSTVDPTREVMSPGGRMMNGFTETLNESKLDEEVVQTHQAKCF